MRHDFGGVALSEFLGSDDSVEQLTSSAELHDDVNISVVDVGLMELDDVGVVDLGKDEEFLLQKFDIFFDVFSENTLDGKLDLRVCLEMGSSHSSEVTTTNHLLKSVDSSDVGC